MGQIETTSKHNEVGSTHVEDIVKSQKQKLEADLQETKAKEKQDQNKYLRFVSLQAKLDKGQTLTANEQQFYDKLVAESEAWEEDEIIKEQALKMGYNEKDRVVKVQELAKKYRDNTMEPEEMDLFNKIATPSEKSEVFESSSEEGSEDEVEVAVAETPEFATIEKKIDKASAENLKYYWEKTGKGALKKYPLAEISTYLTTNGCTRIYHQNKTLKFEFKQKEHGKDRITTLGISDLVNKLKIKESPAVGTI